MLVITRRPVETIDITLEDNRRIEISVLGVLGNKVRLGIDAPKTVVVDRREISERKMEENKSGQRNYNR